jgi:hypothetical protein
VCDRSCAILIVDLFWLVISDACHALIVILSTIRSYGCNDSLEWAATSRQRDQPAQAVATATLPSAAMLEMTSSLPGAEAHHRIAMVAIGWRGHSHLAGLEPPTSSVPRMSPATTSAADLSIAGSALV